jgi:hypothetical protein
VRRKRRISNRWAPWVVIVVVLVVALAVVLPLTLGGSSSTASSTPTSSLVASSVRGSYFTENLEASQLFYLELADKGSGLAGTLAVTSAGPGRQTLITERYAVTATITGSTLHMVLSPTLGGAGTVGANYGSNTISFSLANGTLITLVRGSLAAYRRLVRQDRASLLG